MTKRPDGAEGGARFAPLPDYATTDPDRLERDVLERWRDERVFDALSVDASVAARASYGGTAPDQVRARVIEAKAELGMNA